MTQHSKVVPVVNFLKYWIPCLACTVCASQSAGRSFPLLVPWCWNYHRKKIPRLHNDSRTEGTNPKVSPSITFPLRLRTGTARLALGLFLFGIGSGLRWGHLDGSRQSGHRTGTYGVAHCLLSVTLKREERGGVIRLSDSERVSWLAYCKVVWLNAWEIFLNFVTRRKKRVDLLGTLAKEWKDFWQFWLFCAADDKPNFKLQPGLNFGTGERLLLHGF